MIKSYDDIINEYYYIRQANLQKMQEKKEAVYLEHPLLQEIDKSIIDLYIKKMNGDLDGINGTFENALSALQDKKKKYLVEHYIKGDYLEPIYTCEKCKDTGYIDGKKCSCLIQKEIDAFDEISGFSKFIKTDNFEKINMNYYNQDVPSVDEKRTYKEYMSDTIAHMKEKINNIDVEPYNVLLIGACGTGKTYLAHAIGAEFLKKHKSVLCLNVNDYIASLMPDYDGVSFKTYATVCDLLLLDDLGTENTTDFVRTELYYIIDKRINIGKSTVITTNYTPKAIGDLYMEAMVSRLNLYTKYWLKGNDLRRIKNGSNK